MRPLRHRVHPRHDPGERQECECLMKLSQSSLGELIQDQFFRAWALEDAMALRCLHISMGLLMRRRWVLLPPVSCFCPRSSLKGTHLCKPTALPAASTASESSGSPYPRTPSKCIRTTSLEPWRQENQYPWPREDSRRGHRQEPWPRARTKSPASETGARVPSTQASASIPQQQAPLQGRRVGPPQAVQLQQPCRQPLQKKSLVLPHPAPHRLSLSLRPRGTRGLL
ncbi:uncharacterized protein LOC129020919 [Pongo pygmaeus]|uniref:uncharacterized protein LOC129020919 n=1 Tax=Pongo pygmaeus TaxID=9600 RepID=UPI0023E30F3E|nr:uncharacterized protein LOC129020919 [Pongo pygmaeus]XP_054395853.1 uncharacterized protein LOC100438222 [Pongo abelii]